MRNIELECKSNHSWLQKCLPFKFPYSMKKKKRERKNEALLNISICHFKNRLHPKALTSRIHIRQQPEHIIMLYFCFFSFANESNKTHEKKQEIFNSHTLCWFFQKHDDWHQCMRMRYITMQSFSSMEQCFMYVNLTVLFGANGKIGNVCVQMTLLLVLLKDTNPIEISSHTIESLLCFVRGMHLHFTM